MCLSEVLGKLRADGISASEAQIRWAIRTNKVSRPRIDGSLRFDFSSENVAELAAHFSKVEGMPGIERGDFQ